MDKETDDVGVYNAENVNLKNNSFSDIGGAVLQLYRGGTDESTFDPVLTVTHCIFDNVGKNSTNRYNASISSYGVQVNRIENNIFNKSKEVKIQLVVGEPIVTILNNNLYNYNKIVVSGEENIDKKNTTYFEPKFIENYQLSADSPLVHKASYGLNIGLIQK